jgi:hypothetical protein
MDARTLLSEIPGEQRVLRWPRAVLITLVVLVAVAITARALAPGFIQRAINRRLAEIPGYSGHVGSIHLALWRGAYRIDAMVITKANGKVSEPFFSAQSIDFSVAWRELLHRKFVSDIYITNCRLTFLNGPTDETSQLDTDSRWQDVVNDIFPIDITHLVIKGGVIRYVDTTRTPRVDIAVNDLEVVATGLRNRSTESGEPFPAKIDIAGRTLGNGQLRLNANVEPLADQAHFKLDLELKQVSLPTLNDLLRAYVGIDVSRGELDLFGQMAMQKGHYEGYLKPFMNRVDFTNQDDPNKKIGERLWKGVVVAVIKLFKNSDTRQIATRIPFSGDAKGMDVLTLKSILNGLYNGFIKALPQELEGTTHPDAPSKLPPVPAPVPKADSSGQRSVK